VRSGGQDQGGFIQYIALPREPFHFTDSHKEVEDKNVYFKMIIETHGII
jgi:hypothetical protein